MKNIAIFILTFIAYSLYVKNNTKNKEIKELKVVCKQVQKQFDTLSKYTFQAIDNCKQAQNSYFKLKDSINKKQTKL